MKQVFGWWVPDSDYHWDHYFRSMFAEPIPDRPTYQPYSQKAAYESVTRNGLAIDIGAHVGMWSFVMCKGFDRVLAFEPILENRQCLVLNAPRAEVSPYACWNVRGGIYLENPAPTNSGAWRVSEEKTGVKVKCMPLDSMELTGVVFIKIDIQFGQEAVLLGARETLNRCSPTVCMEGGDGAELLLGLGYEMADRHIREEIWIRKGP